MKTKKTLIAFAVLLLTNQLSFAQDRVFTQTYQSNVIPSGVKEFEYWSTLRSGRTNYYNALDQRVEFEMGLGKKIQTAFYLNVNTESAGTLDGIEQSSSIGFSNEWKFKLTDPVANKFGTALYAEIGFNGNEIELEGKFILDKKAGNNILAFNGSAEYEIKYEVADGKTTTVTETPFELNFAYLHFISNHLGIGLEARNHNEVAEGAGWENSVWYAGPSFHFGSESWLINLNIQPQLFNARKEAGSTETLELSAHEKVEARLIVSFDF